MHPAEVEHTEEALENIDVTRNGQNNDGEDKEEA